LRGEVHGLLRGATLPINRRARYMIGHTCHQPSGAPDIACLGADRITASPNDVVYRIRIHAAAFHQRFDRMCAEVGWMHMSERTFFPPDRRADRFYNICVGQSLILR
jgi:hypothetical protein